MHFVFGTKMQAPSSEDSKKEALPADTTLFSSKIMHTYISYYEGACLFELEIFLVMARLEGKSTSN